MPGNFNFETGLFEEQSLASRLRIANMSGRTRTHGSTCSTCQHHLMNEDVARGLQTNGHMSAVRRFFCLFVTFDLLFTSLLWLICLVLAGNFNFTDAFFKEIVHYTIKTSLFDVVLASLIRFVVLLLFYGLIHIDHWIIVATTTVGTCCFSVWKVYIFDWSSSQQVLSVMLIISCFTLSWAEIWLLDIKVIPQERSAVQYLTGVTNPDERAPLLRSILHDHLGALDLMSDSVAGTFYSPVESPEGSGDEGEGPSKKKFLNDITKYKDGARGVALLREVWLTLNNDQWRLETVTPLGDKIFFQKLPEGERAYCLIAVIDAPIKLLLDVLYKQVGDIPIWNPTVKESKVLQIINNDSDIIYQVSADVGNGLISSRDFVMLRHFGEMDGFFIIASVSIPDYCFPTKKNIIRGENGPGCWALKQVAAFETEVRWLLNTNLRGWLPQYAVDSALKNVMADNMTSLRRRLVALKEVSTTS